MRYQRAWLETPGDWQAIAKADMIVTLEQTFPCSMSSILTAINMGKEIPTPYAIYRRKP